MGDPATAANVAWLLARTARAWPSRPALARGDGVVADYARFAARAARLAAAMTAQGLAPGDRVAIVARNEAGYLEAMFGAWWAGMVAVPVNARLHRDEVAWVLDDCDAGWVYADDGWCPALDRPGGSAGRRVAPLASIDALIASAPPPRADPAPVDRHDPAWLFYTSGTTGRPKGVEITHANLVAMTRWGEREIQRLSSAIQRAGCCCLEPMARGASGKVDHAHARCFGIDAPSVCGHGLDEAERDLGLVGELPAVRLAACGIRERQIGVDAAIALRNFLAGQADQRRPERVADCHSEQSPQECVFRCVGHAVPRFLWARQDAAAIDGPAIGP